MSLKVIHLAAEIENNDQFHIARLLVLLSMAGGRNSKPLQGIMKLAKMDFLLRYPNCLVRVLKSLNKMQLIDSIPEEEQYTIEARMIRFRYGPWDKRYRRWISLMIAQGLVNSYLEGRTVNIKLTDKGSDIANDIASLPEYKSLAIRSKIVASTVGNLSATKLKDSIYEWFPEIVDMHWGKEIEL